MDDMTIWILAILILAAVALTGWRQGAIRAAISFVGILLGALLAVPIGKLIHPLLPHIGASNPLTAWALAPVVGFILVSIVFKVVAHKVHHKVEHFYKYNAGDLRLALWTRVNSRLGICIGLLNGAVYFILISFFIFNAAYLTTQAAVASNQPVTIRLMNRLGTDLQASGLARTATAVGTLPPMYYEVSDLTGMLVQNPQVAPRLAAYPAFTSLWERDDMQSLVQDAILTNSLASGASLGEIMNNGSVQAFLINKDQSKLVVGILETNLTDLTEYLQTGKSAKFDGEKIIGRWEFNPAVTLAWMRQSRPKMAASEMRSLRAWMTQAYAQTRVIVAGDNQIFVKSLPRIKAEAGQAPTTEYGDWKGDWAVNGTNYDLHVVLAGEDKFLTASAEDLRLTVKDGKNLMIFDRAN
jgi:uncharacterized membrane protein required for colicin V production